MEKIDKNNFCIWPFYGFHIKKDGNCDVCCQSSNIQPFLGSINEQDVYEIWNGEIFKSFRKLFYSNKYPQTCQACFNLEKNGIQSNRQRINNEAGYYLEHALNNYNIETGEMNVDPIFLDINVSNKCNFRCNKCCSDSSNSYGKELSKFKEDKNLELNINWNKHGINNFINFIPNVNNDLKIGICGGEPLITEEHYLILKKIKEFNKQKYIRLLYYTNLSKLTYNDLNFIDEWKYYKNVHFSISCDDYFERYEYIRKGGKWETLIENIKNIKKLKNINMNMICTVDILNVLNLTKFLTYIIENNLFDKNIYLGFVSFPKYLNIKNLPQFYKNICIEKINNFKTKYSFLDVHINSLLNLINLHPEENQLKILIDTLKFYNEKRNENVFTIIPELNLLKDWCEQNDR